jgi:hypothetical protein
VSVFSCSECNSSFEAEELPRRGAVCFKCHIKGIRLGFTYGQESFHGPTIKERQEQQVREAAAAGVNAEPVGTRWV